jgi:hypothetical protein
MSDPSPAPHAGDRSEAAARNRKERVLVFIVAFLGLLIVAGIAAVVLRIIYLSANPQPQPGSVETGPRSQLGAVEAGSLSLPQGAVVKSLSLSGDRLAVHYESGGKAAIAILDVSSGAVLRRYDVMPDAALP